MLPDIPYHHTNVRVLTSSHIESYKLPSNWTRAADAHNVVRDVIFDLLKIQAEPNPEGFRISLLECPNEVESPKLFVMVGGLPDDSFFVLGKLGMLDERTTILP